MAQGSIYVIGQGFGLTWKPTYVQVSKRKRQTARDMFKEDVDDSEDVPAPVVGGAKAAFDEEEEEAEAEETEEAPTPTANAGAGSAPAPAPAPVSAAAPAPARRRKVANA